MLEAGNAQKPLHFKDKEAIEHVVEAKAKGILSTAEVHGMEIPGHISSAADAARETAVLLWILWMFLIHFPLEPQALLSLLSLFVLGWAVWKTGRSAWLAWSRLERMHRIVEQERWEIQHHRQQEREELRELYRAKGFEGQLLEDVMDVLMADEERLLKVMVVEELCLSLGTHEHPLKQALGAFLGVWVAGTGCVFLYFLLPGWGMWGGSVLLIALSAMLSAKYEGNRSIPAMVWNVGIAGLAAGSVYFLLQYVF